MIFQGRSILENVRSQGLDLIVLGVTYLGLWGAGIWMLSSLSTGEEWIAWAVSSLAFLGYALGYLVYHLELNVPPGGDTRYPDLGWANRITMWRAGLLGGLFGLIFLMSLQETVRWLAGVLYSLVALLDFVDGWVARRTHRSSRLGEALDMHWDSLGVLIASVLLVRMGQVSPLFVLVGLARFLYVAVIQWRERRGLPLAPLPSNLYRRFMAGIQMGLIAVLLFPVFSPPATTIAAWLWMIPFLTAFLRDGLYVSTAMDEQTDPLLRWGVLASLTRVGPWLFRLLTLISGIGLLLVFPASPYLFWARTTLAGLGLMVLLGLMGRVTGIAWMMIAGFVLSFSSNHPVAWGALVGGFGLLMLGTGRLSVWSPEEWLIYHRAGETS